MPQLPGGSRRGGGGGALSLQKHLTATSVAELCTWVQILNRLPRELPGTSSQPRALS